MSKYVYNTGHWSQIVPYQSNGLLSKSLVSECSFYALYVYGINTYWLPMMQAGINWALIDFCGLCYKNIMLAVRDERKWSLYYKCVTALALASAVIYNHKWRSKLWRHFLTTL
jgi:hypothetical protein